jgi:hypothetical protein
LDGNYRDLDTEHGKSCLPAKLQSLGWRTAGFHGFSGRMFDRNMWWTYLGFDEIHFADSPRFRSFAQCGAAFRGVCDQDVVRAGLQALAPGHAFSYVLTLNTHLPLAPVSFSPALLEVCASAEVPQNTCHLLASLGVTLNGIRDLLKTAPHPPLVVVLGDHAPPFASRASRESFLTRAVPAFLLTPLTAAADASR